MEALFHYILLRVFCYPTESEEKVREALLLLGYGNKEVEAKIEEQVVEGSFGDKIKIMELKIEKAREIKNLCNVISFKGKIKAYPSSRENAISAITDAISRYHNN